MNNRLKYCAYVIYRLLDYLSALLAWFLFFAYRKSVESPNEGLSNILQDSNLYVGLLIIPLAWQVFYWLFDNYNNVTRFSRIATISRTFTLTFIGSLVLYFTILLDDDTFKYTSYIYPFIRLFCLFFTLTIAFRLLFLTWVKSLIRKRIIVFNNLIIGSSSNALELLQDKSIQQRNLGYNFVGYVQVDTSTIDHLEENLACLGSMDDLQNIIKNHSVEEVIIATDSNQHEQLKSILNGLYTIKDKLLIRVIPDIYDILSGTVKMSNIYGSLLMDINLDLMSRFDFIVKRTIDVIVSIIMLILCIPIYILCAIKVKSSSQGTILYLQKRIGKDELPFSIIKFRSMYVDAEDTGPQLAQDTDPRITPWGRIMRKWRLDELPQFYNVLKGDMSLVGPRPERKFYIDQIVAIEPSFLRLLRVRPGITSWGQVKYGYASNVKEMLQRMKYDLLYIENISIALDIKILFYTLIVLINGEGK